MDDNTIKNIANYLSDLLLNNENEFENKFDEIKDVDKIPIIVELAQVYYNVKTGQLPRERGIELQEEIFFKVDYMRRNENT